MHPKLPFGIAQAGKAFRNEITMGQFTFRTLEFDLMEFEYFFDKDKKKWEELFESWQKEVYDFAKSIGLSDANLRWRPHEEFELSHYSSRTEDLEYNFPWGFREMFAVAYRSNFDLSNHEKHSGVEMKYTYPDGTKVVPHVIEPTFGLSRVATVLFFEAYNEEKLENGKTRTVLKFDPKIAPVKAAIFPLQKDEKLANLAKDVYKDLSEKYVCEYEDKGNIGKMYRRHDEIGTPYCITVDYDSLEDKSVTIRDRDTMKQERVEIEKLGNFLTTKL
jgi:glycyl-tRNA synthetase